MKRIIYILIVMSICLLFTIGNEKQVEASEVAQKPDVVEVVANSSWGETYPYGNWTNQNVQIVKDGDNSCLKIEPTAWYPSMIGFKKDVSTEVGFAGDYKLLIDVKSSSNTSVKKGKIDFILVYNGGNIKISDGVSNLSNIKSDSWTTLSFDFSLPSSLSSSYYNLDAYYWAEDNLDNNYVLVDNIRFIKADDLENNIDTIYGGFEHFHHEVSSITLILEDDFEIGKVMPIKFEMKLDGVSGSHLINANDSIRVDYQIENNDIVTSDSKGNLIAMAKGSTKIKASINFYGQIIETNEITVTVGDENLPTGDYIEYVGVTLDRDISLYEYSQIQVSVKLSNGTFLDATEYNLVLSSSNPDVCYIRGDKPYVLIGVGSGSATVYATVHYNGYTLIGSLDVTLETDNYLINPSFEAEGYGWTMSGTAGGGFDNFKTNGFAKTGYGNIWLMAPVYWDNNVKPDSDIQITQNVTLETGKYSFVTYINRFYATGPGNIVLNGVGGEVTIGAQKLDANGNKIGEPIEAAFDTSYGNGQYGKLSVVFDVVETGDYQIFIKVKGDSKLGLGMQIDDASLTKAVYPERISATINEESIEVDDLYKIMVYAHYADGTKELLTSDLRFIFSDYKVACDSKGFVIGRNPGKTIVTVKAQILDKVYETTFEVVVNGEIKTEEPEENNGCGGAIALSLAGLVPLTFGVVILRKKCKKEEE